MHFFQSGRRGFCGIKMFIGSSTGTLLVKKDEAIEEVIKISPRVVVVVVVVAAAAKKKKNNNNLQEHPSVEGRAKNGEIDGLHL